MEFGIPNFTYVISELDAQIICKVLKLNAKRVE